MVKPRAHYFFVRDKAIILDVEKIRWGLDNFPGYENTGFYNEGSEKPSNESSFGIRPKMDFSFKPLNFWDYKKALVELFETFYEKSFERELTVNVSGAPAPVASAATTALHIMGIAPFSYSNEGGVIFIGPTLPRIENSLEFSGMQKSILKHLKTKPGSRPSQISKTENKGETAAISVDLKKLRNRGLVERVEKHYDQHNLTDKGRLTAELVEIKDDIDRRLNK